MVILALAMRCLVVGVLVAGACGASHQATPGDGSNPIDGPTSTGSDAGVDAAWDWQPLISNTWTEAAGQSNVRCTLVPITQEMWIDGFRPAAAMNPANDHQFVIVTPNSGGCGSMLDRPLYSQDELVYAAGLGSDVSEAQFTLPAGLAVHLTPTNLAGQSLYLILYDHIANEGTSAVSDTSSIEVHVVADPTTVAHEVDMVLGGNGEFTVPTGDTPMTVDGPCTPTTAAGYQWHLVGVWPHMHESGQHVTVSIAGQATPIYDAAYDYQHEGTHLVRDTLVDTGAELDVRCTLANANPVALSYDEIMPEPDGRTVCWTGLYKYPTGTDPNLATHTPVGPEACVVGSRYQYPR